MKRNKSWIIINSFLAFVSAFIFIKAVIIFTKFIVIRYFGGSTQLENFEMECVTWSYSSFWTTESVISIYLIGFFVSLILILISIFLFKKFKTVRGFIKLWFSWLYVFAVNQSIGMFLRDIPFERDIYHALNWMFIPYALMIVIAVLSLPLLFAMNYGNDIRFLRMAPSFDNIISNRRRRFFYTNVALIPSVLGSMFILLLHLYGINLFEIVEKLLIIFAILIAYMRFTKDDLIVEFHIVKDEPINKPSPLLITMFIVTLFSFLFLKNIYF